MENREISKDRDIEVGGERDSSGFGEVFEPEGKRLLLVLFIMEIRAVGFLAGEAVQARLCLEEVRVEFLLFPTVTVGTTVFHRTAF
jgi:hypothetical protein